MTHIDRLNRRLGEALGYVGTNPRFAWKWSPDVQYYYRSNLATSFERQCWADHVGPVWILCQFRPPEISQADWWASFRGEFPYPHGGMYYAHPEVAMPRGMEPDAEETARVIYALRQQMGKGHALHLSEINERLEQGRIANKKEFMDMADDSFPAFWRNGQGHEPGTRGAHVSIGGV